MDLTIQGLLRHSRTEESTETVRGQDRLPLVLYALHTSLFFSPTKRKRIGAETEETFTVVCSYRSTSLPVKKLDKDLSIFLIFQKEIRPGTDRRHPWSTAEILQNLAASPAMMVSPNHPGTARRKPTDVKAETSAAVQH